MKDLGQRIRELRKNHLNLTQEQFGEKLGVSRTVIKNIELNHLARPEQKEPLLRLICSTFNVNYEWLKEGTGEMRGGEKVEATDELTESQNDERKRRLYDEHMSERETRLRKLALALLEQCKDEEMTIQDYADLLEYMRVIIKGHYVLRKASWL